jgi:hypothetical protein
MDHIRRDSRLQWSFQEGSTSVPFGFDGSLVVREFSFSSMRVAEHEGMNDDRESGAKCLAGTDVGI